MIHKMSEKQIKILRRVVVVADMFQCEFSCHFFFLFLVVDAVVAVNWRFDSLKSIQISISQTDNDKM